uniref:Uncharacterized protein n=1 Tax=Glaucocystis incrassata TaxID=1789788 RepID=A0A3G1IVA0_9EUKA|nr:hypothetical protein [Glaucocystis incrassata]ASQ39970.1 hypothetical protein [Glaucocystis incrassata]
MPYIFLIQQKRQILISLLREVEYMPMNDLQFKLKVEKIISEIDLFMDEYRDHSINALS